MRAPSVLQVVTFVGYFALFLAAALAALNVVYSARRAVRGAGPSAIPVVVTVVGALGLRVLSLTLHRPTLFGVGPVLLLILLDFGSWLLPPLVCAMLGTAARDRR